MRKMNHELHSGDDALQTSKKTRAFIPDEVVGGIDADRSDQILVGKRLARSTNSTFISRPHFSKFRKI